jgi:hypothetical protein
MTFCFGLRRQTAANNACKAKSVVMRDCMPPPVRISAHPTAPFPSDLRGEHRAKSVPPEPNRFVADVDPALVQEIFHVPQ